jgi:hypothetical protein
MVPTSRTCRVVMQDGQDGQDGQDEQGGAGAGVARVSRPRGSLRAAGGAPMTQDRRTRLTRCGGLGWMSLLVQPQALTLG